MLSERLADEVEVTLIDQNDAFTLGFSKLDLLFRHRTRDDVLLPHRRLANRGVTFRQQTVVSIDLQHRRVATDKATHEADFLVVALGADYDQAATPGFVEGGFEYYSLDGAERLRDELPSFHGGRYCSPSCQSLSNVRRPRRRGSCCCTATWSSEGFARRLSCMWSLRTRRRSRSHPKRRRRWSKQWRRGTSSTPRVVASTASISPTRWHILKDHDEPYDLFIGIPVHKVPDVLVEAGLTENGWVKVDPFTLATAFPGVCALGDCAETGIPKAGVFAESAARAVAVEIAASIRGGRARPYDGTGLCFVEMGEGEVGRVDVHFRAEGGPTAPLLGPSQEYATQKAEFGAVRRARWFDL